MKRRQIERAARIYALAMIANMDQGGCETDDEAAVVARAVETAKDRLTRMGIGWGEVNNLPACLQQAVSGEGQS